MNPKVKKGFQKTLKWFLKLSLDIAAQTYIVGGSVLTLMTIVAIFLNRICNMAKALWLLSPSQWTLREGLIVLDIFVIASVISFVLGIIFKNKQFIKLTKQQEDDPGIFHTYNGITFKYFKSTQHLHPCCFCEKHPVELIEDITARNKMDGRIYFKCPIGGEKDALNIEKQKLEEIRLSFHKILIAYFQGHIKTLPLRSEL